MRGFDDPITEIHENISVDTTFAIDEVFKFLHSRLYQLNFYCRYVIPLYAICRVPRMPGIGRNLERCGQWLTHTLR